MPMYKSKSCKKLVCEEGRIDGSESGIISAIYHAQIWCEESMVIPFLTNFFFFFFAGIVISSMSYFSRHSHMAVLVPSTHSSGRKLRIGSSINNWRFKPLDILMQKKLTRGSHFRKLFQTRTGVLWTEFEIQHSSDTKSKIYMNTHR